MTRHIGIVGCSAEGAALCYRTICSEAEASMGEHHHPEVSMHTFSLASYMRLIDAGDWHGVADLMSRSAGKLAEIGADFAICPDNTIHQAYEHAEQQSALPWLNIAESVAKEAGQRGFRKVAVTGTSYLMTGPVYRSVLQKFGIEYVVPEKDDRREINRIIFEELVKGIFTDEARDYVNAIFDKLHSDGCDAVVMGCTEIPLLMDGVKTTMPTLDSTRILARAALSYATDEIN